MPWALLAAGALAMFAASASGPARAPFLLAMARDLDTPLALIADLVAATSVPWAIAGMIAGPLSDRWGRRPFLLLGPVALCGSLAGIATAPTFAMVALWAIATGFCAGMFSGVIYAEASARVGEGQQGSALGWITSGQSLVLLAGVPAAAWVGEFIGWRGVHSAIAVLGLISAVGLFATTRGGPSSRRPPGAKASSPLDALTWPVARLLTLGIADRVCYGMSVVYFATFLQSTYHVGIDAVVIPLAIFASGNIVGTILGGHLADRVRDRMLVFATSTAASGLAAMALFGWHPGVMGSVGLGFTFVFLNAIGRPLMMAALADVPPAIRGTVMGWNMTAAGLGWMGAAALGGWMLGQQGFDGFGSLTMIVACGAALLALFQRPMTVRQTQPAQGAMSWSSVVAGAMALEAVPEAASAFMPFVADAQEQSPADTLRAAARATAVGFGGDQLRVRWPVRILAFGTVPILAFLLHMPKHRHPTVASAPKEPALVFTDNDWTAPSFRFHTGETLQKLRVHYVTLGDPSGQPVLILHDMARSAEAMMGPSYTGELFGPGQPLDAKRYFIIIPDILGAGSTSRPSEGQRAKFPHYNNDDMVQLQYRLLTEGMNIRHVRLITGTGMGGMLTWVWGVTYPGFMDSLAPVAAQPARVPPKIWNARHKIVEAIRQDPAYHDGEYAAQPPSLEWPSMFFGLTQADASQTAAAPPRGSAWGTAKAATLPSGPKVDANDLIYQFEASKDYNPGPGLEKIQARVLAIEAVGDEQNPPDPAVTAAAMKRIKRGQSYLIPASAEPGGHPTTAMIKLWKKQLDDFLK